jgi:hypothetical protein
MKFNNQSIVRFKFILAALGIVIMTGACTQPKPVPNAIVVNDPGNDTSVDNAGDTGGSDENTLQENLQISVDPVEGLNGTTGKIIVMGAPAQASLDLKVGDVIIQLQTDTDGTASHQAVFYGESGEQITIEVTAASNSGIQTSSTSFGISGLLEQSYKLVITDIPSDDGEFALLIMFTRVFEIWVREGSLFIEAPEPWVNVEGELNPDGSFYAEGRGMVMWQPDIAVTFTGTISMSEIQGEYVMGVDGGLPGGYSITFVINGSGTQLTGQSAPGVDFNEISAFYSLLSSAHHFRDAEGMLSMLHTAVIDRYGRDACLAHINATMEPEILYKPHEAVKDANWNWVLDGKSTTIAEAYDVYVIALTEDGENPQNRHLARKPDGSLGWFTDCGEPLP